MLNCSGRTHVKHSLPPNNSSRARPVDIDRSHPSASFVTRVVYVGGRNKQQLLVQLLGAKVKLNEAAHTLFSSEKFTTLVTPQPLTTVELAVRDLGFAHGATPLKLRDKAVALGLRLAPIELGPHLRLQYLDQPEGHWAHPVTDQRAPSGSLTVASAPLSEDDQFPKGFYLRRIRSTLWLRAYRCSSEHMWDPDDRFVFCRP
jgi:hypothetical protein